MLHRSSLSWSLCWLLLAAGLAGADCRSNDKPTPPLANVKASDAAPPNEGLTEEEAARLLPGIETASLTPRQRQDLVDLSRDTFCPCSAETVAGCIRKGPDTCHPAMRLMELAKKLTVAGMPESRVLLYVESYYGGFDDAHRIDLPQEGPTEGAQNGRIVVEEFSDFQCPVCRAAHPVMAELAKKYPNDVKIVYRFFPLPQHEHAQKAALCGAYAYDKGGNAAFWKMADHFFSHQDQLGDDEFKAAARAAGLNPDEMLTAIGKDPKYAAQVEADKKLGMDAKIGGTPTVFINGRQVELPKTLEYLSWAVEDEFDWMANGKKWANK